MNVQFQQNDSLFSVPIEKPVPYTIEKKVGNSFSKTTQFVYQAMT